MRKRSASCSGSSGQCGARVSRRRVEQPFGRDVERGRSELGEAGVAVDLRREMDADPHLGHAVVVGRQERRVLHRLAHDRRRASTRRRSTACRAARCARGCRRTGPGRRAGRSPPAPTPARTRRRSRRPAPPAPRGAGARRARPARPPSAGRRRRPRDRRGGRPARTARAGRSARRRGWWRTGRACRRGRPPPPIYSQAVQPVWPGPPRWRRKRWNSRARTSPEGSCERSVGPSSSSAARSSRSTNACTSGSSSTARVTWRS